MGFLSNLFRAHDEINGFKVVGMKDGEVLFTFKIGDKDYNGSAFAVHDEVSCNTNPDLQGSQIDAFMAECTPKVIDACQRLTPLARQKEELLKEDSILASKQMCATTKGNEQLGKQLWADRTRLRSDLKFLNRKADAILKDINGQI